MMKTLHLSTSANFNTAYILPFFTAILCDFPTRNILPYAMTINPIVSLKFMFKSAKIQTTMFMRQYYQYFFLNISILLKESHVHKTVYFRHH